MAIKISQLVATAPASALDGTEQLELVQGGVSKGGTFAQVRDYVLLGATRIPGQKFTIDLDSQAATDPGAGLLKFNNASPASATAIYIDDLTLDGIDLSTFFGTLGSTGWIKMQSALDENEWIIFRWTARVDSTGFWTFTVVAQAVNGALDDEDDVIVVFDSDAQGNFFEKQVACSDLATTSPVVGEVGYFRAPCAVTLTEIRISLRTAQTSGDIFTVDVKKNGTSLFTTLLTIDNGEKTSEGAATASVLVGGAAWADDDEITIEVTQVGDGTALGLICTFIGQRI